MSVINNRILFRLVIVIATIIAKIAIVNGGESTQGHTYDLTYTNNNVPEDHLESYFEQLERNFAQHGLKLNRKVYHIEIPPGDIQVDFRADYDGSRIIIGQHLQVTIRNSSLEDISPVLVGEDKMAFSTTPKAEADLTTALFFYIDGQCEVADEYLQNVNRTIPEVSEIYYEPTLAFFQGGCSLQQNDFQSAITYFTEASTDNPDRPPYLSAKFNLAWTYLQLDNDAAAFAILEPLATLPDEFLWGEEFKTYILSKRAQLYALAERHDDAIVDLTNAIELPPVDTPDLYVLRGQMYLALYEWDSALADYNRAIELDPDYADAYYERGLLYYSILQTGVELRADALADFRHYLELAPEGDKADDAARYIEQIETELEALNE